MKELIQGLDRVRNRSLDGAKNGLKGAAAGITFEMRQTGAHGDVTGATRANYTAYVVGRGETGSNAIQSSISAVNALNPGHVAQSSVTIKGELGVIITSFTDYQAELETENAGQKAVLGPTVASIGSRCTQAAASGSKRALS